MTIAELFFFLFSFMLITSSVMVISARNPVYSVVFLILAFFNAAGLFILLGAEFVAMIIVIVLCWSCCCLFLFVVMMLDIDFVQLRKGFQQYLPFGFLIGIILCIEICVVLTGYHLDVNTIALSTSFVDNVSNTKMLGHVLYTEYVYYFQLAGLILLVAMISAIVLTLKHRVGVKRQDPASQSARRVEESIEIKKVESHKGMY